MKSRTIAACFCAVVLALVLCLAKTSRADTQRTWHNAQDDPLAIGPQSVSTLPSGRYACEDDLIEVVFVPESRVRMRGGALVDLATRALDGIEGALSGRGTLEWTRECNVPEEVLDELQVNGEANSDRPVYNLNNIYRLRIEKGHDVWRIAEELEALPGVLWARPVPKPTPPPLPPNYTSQQGYLQPATSTPVGLDIVYAFTQPGGKGLGVTVCDLEYSWNYNHADISKAPGSQINTNVVDPFSDPEHGTAVIGLLVADNNGWGVTGICHQANLRTCGTYYGTPTPSWNVAGAIALAIANLDAGDVILLEQQWEYNQLGGQYIPIEWWGDVNSQSWNPVYTAIVNAVSNGIHVVEAGGNGAYNTDMLNWHSYGSGAIVVGAGGVYAGGTYPEGDLQKLSFASYGTRYDLQGWGENVVSTGYGDLYDGVGSDSDFTNTFAGTSSASPIVAGAVGCCMGFWKSLGGSGWTLSPSILRTVLKNTATAQVTPPAGNIGGRPNLQAAFPYFSTPPEWNDVTPRLLSRYGSVYSTAWGDYDVDGDYDLFMTMINAPDSSRLFRNDAGAFTNVTPSGMDTGATGSAGVWGDYDNDGDPDLYVSRNDYRPNRLYRNNGAGSFTDVSSTPLNDALCSGGAAWVDYDRDRDLDLYLCQYVSANRMFRNDGGGVFVDATSGPLGDTLQTAMSLWGDYDNDNDQDVFLVNWNGPNKLLRNNGNGSFTDVTTAPLAIPSHSAAADWGDYDNDGDLDLFVAVSWSLLSDKLFRNDGAGVFTDVTPVPMQNWDYTSGAAWGDYDNDGDLDLFAVNGQNEPNRLFRNNGGGSFVEVYQGNLINPLRDQICTGRGGTWADYDKDGDLDIFLSNMYGLGCRSRLFRNEVGDNNHWIQIKPVGTISNKASIGARVRIVSGSLKQIREITTVSGGQNQSPPIAAFGLGSATTIDSLIVRWPSDTVRVYTSLPADTLLVVYETENAYVCGDANGDAAIDISDAVFLIAYIFTGGAAPNPLAAGDANCDAAVDISDAVYLIAYIFTGGAPPCAGCK
jgi:serine protease